MKTLPDNNYIFRMINTKVDRRILKSKEFYENIWKDYLNKLEKRNSDSFFDYTIRVKKYKEKLAEMEEIIRKEREARYEEAFEEDASR